MKRTESPTPFFAKIKSEEIELLSSGAEIAIWFAIKSFAGKSGICFASIRQITHRSKTSKETASRAIEKLIKVGLIEDLGKKKAPFARWATRWFKVSGSQTQESEQEQVMSDYQTEVSDSQTYMSDSQTEVSGKQTTSVRFHGMETEMETEIETENKTKNKKISPLPPLKGEGRILKEKRYFEKTPEYLDSIPDHDLQALCLEFKLTKGTVLAVARQLRDKIKVNAIKKPENYKTALEYELFDDWIEEANSK